ncbi:hypothetical protein [Sphingomonas profundi]|uniref:hypothetical protein n=1 Tax=Alterirhizorhabdus profundi TaxID=2681549 RepID=UPI0012E71FB1|nr:hypothetical protein [Sphingomonas profundi]
MATADEIIKAAHILIKALDALLQDADFMDFPVLGRLPFRLSAAIQQFERTFPVGVSRSDFARIEAEIGEAAARAGTIRPTVADVNDFLREAFEAIDRLDAAVAHRIAPTA